MSRIGNAPIQIPKEAVILTEGVFVVVKGPKGELRTKIPNGISIKQTEAELNVEGKKIDKSMKAIHGFVRAKIANDIEGVTKGWSKTLELSGVGYRASQSGADLVLTVGFSHPVTIKPPTGISFAIVEGKIVVSGIDKHLVGQISADVRSVKKPEPYKGKGIMYSGEHIRKKAGKAAKAIGGPPAGGGGK